MHAGINTIFGDIDWMGALTAGILGGDSAGGALTNVLTPLTEVLRTVENAFNTADTAVDNFFENFNASTVGPMMDEWAAAIGQAWNNLWPNMKETLSTWWAGIRADWSANWSAFSLSIGLGLTFLGLAWTAAWETLKETVATWWTNLKADWAADWELFRQGLDLGLVIVGLLWETGWTTLKQTVADWWISFKEQFGIDWLDFENSVGLALTVLDIIWTNTWDGITGTVKGAWDDIKTYVKGIVNDIIADFNSIIGKINRAIGKWNNLEANVGGFNFTAPNWVPGVGGQSWGWGGFNLVTPDLPALPTIPSLAEGGIIPPSIGGTLARLGEAGQAEAVIPLDSPQAARLGVGGGSGTVIYAENIYGWDNLRDLLAEAGVDIQIGGARNSFAGI